MNQYLTIADLEDHLGVTRFTNLCGSDDPGEQSAAATAVIARAEALVDGFAGVRYRVPLERTDLITAWTLSIAEYELYRRGPGSTIPEKVRETYRNTLDRLAELAAGRMETGGELKPKTENLNAPPINISAPASLFRRDHHNELYG